MIEIQGNIFDFIGQEDVDAICITTNGIVSNNGYACMGAGTAGECARRYPEVKYTLGKLLKNGNNPYIIGYLDDKCNYSSVMTKNNKQFIFSFPTKHHFKDRANIELIKNSSIKIVEYANELQLNKIMIPQPGTGLYTGKLNWNKEVKLAIENVLDDRFFIVYL